MESDGTTPREVVVIMDGVAMVNGFGPFERIAIVPARGANFADGNEVDNANGIDMIIQSKS